MNGKQLKDLDNIKKLAESICKRTPVDKHIVDMIIKLADDIKSEETNKRSKDWHNGFNSSVLLFDKNDMTFTEWYEEKQGQIWHEDFALMYQYASEMLDLYDKWCKDNNQEPIYNG